MSSQVLVVDDDDLLKEALEYVLSDYGFEMVAVTNGKDALDWLKSHASPQVILLDLMMPEMSGREFIQLQKSDDRIKDIPTIIMSASVELDEELNQFDFLRKPFDINVMIEKIKSAH